MKTILFPKLCFIILLLVVSQMLQAQWIKQKINTTERLFDVVMIDSSTAIVVGENQNIFKTTNSGLTWNYTALPLSIPMSWKSISFGDKYNGVIAGVNSIFTTTDGGDTWFPYLFESGKKFLSALYIDCRIWVGDDSGFIYLSKDSGKTWTSEKISQYPIQSIFVFRGTSTDGPPLYALTTHSIITKNQYIFETPWVEKELEFFDGLGSQAFGGEFCNGGGTGFIVGVHGDKRAAPVILRKPLSDTSWYKVTLNPEPDGEIFQISAPSEKVSYACGSAGLMFKSTDEGYNWLLQSVPTSQPLNSVSFFDETRGFAVGDSGTILFTSNGGITDVSEESNSIPDKITLLQNYPNPFNPSTIIQFNIEKESAVQLQVYNSLGQLVATLVNGELSAGFHKVTFNPAANSISSGFYYYTLRTGNSNLTRGMLYLK